MRPWDWSMRGICVEEIWRSPRNAVQKDQWALNFEKICPPELSQTKMEEMRFSTTTKVPLLLELNSYNYIACSNLMPNVAWCDESDLPIPLYFNVTKRTYVFWPYNSHTHDVLEEHILHQYFNFLMWKRTKFLASCKLMNSRSNRFTLKEVKGLCAEVWLRNEGIYGDSEHYLEF